MREYPTTGIKNPAFRDDAESQRFFLSNMYERAIIVDGLEYASSEHAFVAGKCVHPADVTLIRLAVSPQNAKRLGKAIQLIRPDWEFVQVEHMLKCQRAKYGQHADLADRLVETGDEELIEYNTWKDRYWGVFQGRGENRLGILLMKVRAEIVQARAQAEAAAPWLQ